MQIQLFNVPVPKSFRSLFSVRDALQVILERRTNLDFFKLTFYQAKKLLGTPFVQNLSF